MRAAAVAGDCSLAGRWKSDEARTPASLHTSGKVNDNQRTLFEHHDYGRLSKTYTCEAIAIRDAGGSETFADELLPRNGHQITIRTYDGDSDEGKVRALRLDPDGGC